MSKKSFALAALALTSVLGLAKTAEATVSADFFMFTSETGERVSHVSLGDKILFKGKAKSYPLSQDIVLMCGLQRNANGNFSRDPQSDVLAVPGFELWQGGASVKKIDGVSILAVQPKATSDQILAAVLMPDHQIIARTCETNKAGDILSCSKERLDPHRLDLINHRTGKVILPVDTLIEASAKPIEGLCNSVMQSIFPTLTTREKAAILTPNAPLRDKHKRNDRQQLQLILNGGRAPK